MNQEEELVALRVENGALKAQLAQAHELGQVKQQPALGRWLGKSLKRKVQAPRQALPVALSSQANPASLPTAEQPSLSKLLAQRWPLMREALITLALAAGVGIIAGLGAVLFRFLIIGFGAIFGVYIGQRVLSPLGHWTLAIIPALGLLAVGLIGRLASEVKGQGVPQVMESLAVRGGRIRARVGVLGIIAPAICIGSGCSVGREGPIALIGAAFGSTVAQVFKLPERVTRLLVAAGAAGGIAATFNAPLAGAFFGLEVILGDYTLSSIPPLLTASVTSTIVFGAIVGNQTQFPTPHYLLHNAAELGGYALLGVLGGLVGVCYTKLVYSAEDQFALWRSPIWVKAILGGITIGTAGLFFPQILGSVYEPIQSALSGDLLQGSLGLLAALFVLKLIVTPLSIGAGASGGVSTPSLFIGVMLGALYGKIAHLLLPGLIPVPGGYALVGMALVFASAAQAPITAILILLELTNDYLLTLPLMLAVGISYLIYGLLLPDSIYTLKLSRRGIRFTRGGNIRPLRMLPVWTAMVRPEVINLQTPVAEVYAIAVAHPAQEVVITDEGGKLYALVTFPELYNMISEGEGTRRVSELVTREETITITPEESLELATELFARYNVSTIPVVKSAADGMVVGILHSQDVTTAFVRQVAQEGAN